MRDVSGNSDRSPVSDWIKLFRYLVRRQKEKVLGNILSLAFVAGGDIAEIMNEKMYERNEVESIINKRFSKPIAILIRRKLRERYPAIKWGQEIPVSGIQNILIGEHLEDLN